MSHVKEYFITINRQYGPHEFREKGSRFISYLLPVKSADEADAFVARLRKEYKDPTHVCSAFRLGNGVGDENYFRYSDDGEPGGTAGLPIYNELKSKGYLNVACAVIRYFGGTKLGTGGLVRAYGASARNVLEVSKPVTIHIKEEISFTFPYNLTGDIMHLIGRGAALTGKDRGTLEILHRQYGAEGVSIKLAVPVSQVETLIKTLSDVSAGKIKI